VQVALVAASLLSAAGQIRAGQAAQAQYNAQAQMAAIQGKADALRARQEAIAYKDAGTQHLLEMRRNLATINARAAQGSLDPFSGSTGSLIDANISQGYQDYATQVDNALLAQENARIAEAGGRYQANIYRQAGRTAATTGMFNAAGSLAAGAFQYKMIGGMR